MSNEITGHEEVLARLQRLRGDESKKILRAGLNAAGDVILAAIEQAAPVGKTGRLKQNLKKRRISVRKGVMRMKVGADNSDFTGPAFYTPMVAWGHKIGSRKLGDARAEVKPNDFILRGYDAAKERAVEEMTQTISDGINKLAAGGNA